MTIPPPPPPLEASSKAPIFRHAQPVPESRHLKRQLKEAWAKRGIWNQNAQAYEYKATFKPVHVDMIIEHAIFFEREVPCEALLMRPEATVVVPFNPENQVYTTVPFEATAAVLHLRYPTHLEVEKRLLEHNCAFVFCPPPRFNFKTWKHPILPKNVRKALARSPYPRVQMFTQEELDSKGGKKKKQKEPQAAPVGFVERLKAAARNFARSTRRGLNHSTRLRIAKEIMTGHTTEDVLRHQSKQVKKKTDKLRAPWWPRFPRS